ncbi:GAP family protein [Nocardia sp. NPDC024068]|uniref:GAP family protein n=1 Tax=Nocardia sp. NPDC024068 TaxID=3157197 RepID=UPI0033EB6E22
MSDLAVRLLPEIVGLVVTPGAIAGCILLLRSSRPVRNPLVFGSAFVFVYLLIALSALLGGATGEGSTSHRASAVAGLLIGLLFLGGGILIAARPLRKGNGRPGLLDELRDAGPRRVLVAGLGLAVINPNLFIMMSGMSVIASSHVGPGRAVLATVALLLAAALDFLIPIGVYLALGARARRGLERAEKWMLARSRAIGMGVLFGFGALFTIRGIMNLI